MEQNITPQGASGVPQDAGKTQIPPQKKPEFRTGVIRSDIQFIPPGEHGDYAMIFDPLSEAYYKLSERSCRILQLMDRSYEFSEFLARVNSFGLDCDKAELLELINFLHANNLVAPEYGALNMKVMRHREMKEKTTFHRIMGMYLFFRLPPIHPDGFFTATMPFIRMLFNRFTLFFIVAAALGGYILLLRSWNEAYATFVNSLSWAGLVKYFWALLITKSVHELAHGYTAKSFGARVRSMGISFIVFYPRLFVDLTDTWRLSRAKRTACDGAGIASELIFGGLAAIVWVYAQPGPLKSTMFYLFTVSALGTLLVNGNPFIRYDGYYLLCDFMNIENLMQRSSEFIKAWNRRFFLGIGSWPDSGDCSPLTLYVFGISAFIYRLFLYTSIILIIYFKFTKPVAIILMAIEVYTMLLMPVIFELKALKTLRKRMSWAKTLLTALAVCGLVSLLFIPLPWSFSLPCEIVPETRRMVTVNESAFAAKELKDEPFSVEKGDLILPFRNVFLDFNIRRYEISADRNRAELNLLRSDTKTIGASPAVYEKLRANLLTQNEMKRRRSNMAVRAEAAGIFVPAIKGVSEGRWLEKGTVLGEIVSKEIAVYAYALDREVNRIQKGDRVMIRLRGELKEYPGRIGSLNPVAVKFRDSTLVQAMGGIVPCYPNRKTHEFTPVNVLYCITVIPDEPILCRSGRTGQAEVRKTYRMSVELVRSLMHIFYREFSF